SRRTIFLEYQRLAKDDGSEKGLGLGLAIVDRIARMLGHRVELRSEVGRGSCFSVSVPRAAADAAVLPAARRRAAGFGGALVACIDNDAAILEGMAALLEGWQCRVVGAATAPEVIARLAGRRPDLLL